MTTIHRHPEHDDANVVIENEIVTSAPARKALAVLRIGFGLTFLWAFFDKLLALGFSTGHDPEGNLDRFGPAAWINGGSPTEGFLKFGADGPFKDFYNSFAGAAWANWLFMLGLVGIGLALTFGFGMRFAAAAGPNRSRLPSGSCPVLKPKARSLSKKAHKKVRPNPTRTTASNLRAGPLVTISSSTTTPVASGSG